MAEFRSWDRFDLRSINFSTQYYDATDRKFFDDQNQSLHGQTYEDILELYFPYSDDGHKRTIDFYGSDIAIANGKVTSGTITAMYGWHYDEGEKDWFYNLEIRDFSISAVALAKAQVSDAVADDKALIQKIFSGSDKIYLSRYADWMAGYAGNDFMRSGGQNDTLLGGTGNDTLIGDAGNDLLQGGSGADLIRGGGGHDELWGGADKTKDIFVFTEFSGVDTIKDFENRIDRIEIQSGARNFSQLKIVDAGGDVEIQFKNVAILIEGIQPGQINAGDFIFS